MQFVKPAVATDRGRDRDVDGGAPACRWRAGEADGAPERPVLIHQLWGGFEGEASDIEIQARETIALKRRIEELIVQHSGQTPEKGLRRYGTRLLHDRGGSRRVRIIDRVLTHRFD